MSHEIDRLRAKEIGLAGLDAFYGSRGADLEADADFLSRQVGAALSRKGFGDLVVKSRAKGIESARDKICRKCDDPKSHYAADLLEGKGPQQIMTDLIGVRVTCRFADEIDPIVDVIRNEFKINEAECIDFRQPSDFRIFGYAALHLIGLPIEVKFPQVYYSGVAFEVQIRTALQDHWSVVNWDLAYAIEREVPYDTLRRISMIAALFHLVDLEFMRLRDSASEIAAEGKTNSLSLSDPVQIALSRRGIKATDIDALIFGQNMLKAKQIFANVKRMPPKDELDALALYLTDQKRFRFLVNDVVAQLADKPAVSLSNLAR